MPNILSIPFTRSFADDLAYGLLEDLGDDIQALADFLILLPTNRSCKALRDAFLRASDGKPLILPRMQAIGDVDEDELLLTGHLGGFPGGDAALSVPPAVPILKRQLILTQLVLRFQLDEDSQYTPEQATKLAGELAKLLDQAQTEGVDLERLEDLVAAESEFSAHWQHVVRFLDIVRKFWPVILEEDGSIDPADRRNRLMDMQADLWRSAPPDYRVIAAGATGSIPATARLMDVIARMPNGQVILPGLDQDMDLLSWRLAGEDETHPQYSLFHLLRVMGANREDVQIWPYSRRALKTHSHARARSHLLSEIMRPSAASHLWSGLDPLPNQAIDGMQIHAFPDSAAEARAIALMMREILETPGKTAALVTPDRGLARRVAGELKRWDIDIDDSAGIPMHLTPPGGFMRLLAEAALSGFAPVALLALLKHPFAAAGMDAAKFRAAIRVLDQKVLRGTKPNAGLDGLQVHYDQALQASVRSRKIDGVIRQEPDGEIERIGPFLNRLVEILHPLEAILKNRTVSVSDLLDVHIAVTEKLAADQQRPGADRLWREEAGEMMSKFLTELREAADLMEDIPARDYPAFFESLMTGRMVRQIHGLHPRLFIYGPLEARLQRKDVMFIGGMNEKIWPPEAPADPWMSRPMRRMIGLPVPEYRIGLSANDFCQIFGSEDIVLTRSYKADGQPQVPSRWWLRMEVLLQMMGLWGPLQARSPAKWEVWQQALGRTDHKVRLLPPEPKPPVAFRPRDLSVTRIETLMKDPYSIYAGKILKLKKLEALEMDLGVSEKGTFIHDALDQFSQAYPKAMPQDSMNKLLAIGEEVFGDSLEQPAVWAFWWPRFERIAQWFVKTESDRRALVSSIWTEKKGSHTMLTPHGPFTISGTADRIDLMRSGEAVIIDYKTGTPPSRPDVEKGRAPQLTLEALMLKQGAFDDIPGTAVEDLEYWQVNGGDIPGKIYKLSGKTGIEGMVEDAERGVKALIDAFDLEDTPYLAHPKPEIVMPYNDYDPLSRYREWMTNLVSDAEAE